MSGFASAQAAYEAPPDDAWRVDCPECDGSGQVIDTDSIEEASTVAATPKVTCPDCDGTGEIEAENHPDWCDRCGLVGNCPECDPPDVRDV